MKSYLIRVNEILFDTMKATFETNDIEHFKNMFIYGDDPHKCQSGHDDIVLDGWLHHFYMDDYYKDNHYSWPNYIKKFPSHFNCLPYADKDESG